MPVYTYIYTLVEVLWKTRAAIGLNASATVICPSNDFEAGNFRRAATLSFISRVCSVEDACLSYFSANFIEYIYDFDRKTGTKAKAEKGKKREREERTLRCEQLVGRVTSIGNKVVVRISLFVARSCPFF